MASRNLFLFGGRSRPGISLRTGENRLDFKLITAMMRPTVAGRRISDQKQAGASREGDHTNRKDREMRKIVLSVCALAGLALVTAAPSAEAQPYQYTMAGASPGGLWSNLGVGMDQVMKAAYPGSTVTYQTTGGGIANVLLLQQKKVQLGVVHNVELQMAIDGKPPFKKPIKDLRLLAYLYNWTPFQLIVTKDCAESNGLKTPEDIIKKKEPVRVVLTRRATNETELAGSLKEDRGVR